MISHEQKEAVKARRNLVMFARVFPIIMAAIGGLFYIRDRNIVAYVFFGLAAIGALTALFIPQAFKKFFNAWMKFGEGMAWIITNFILLVMFIFLFLPIGLILKLFGKDVLDERFHDDSASCWNPMTLTEWEKKQYEKPVGRLRLLIQFMSFMRERKKFWLVPLTVTLILLGLLLIFAQGSFLAPFIYALF